MVLIGFLDIRASNTLRALFYYLALVSALLFVLLILIIMQDFST